MTQEEINKLFPNNCFTFGRKKYELKPALVSKTCIGCCFISSLDCGKRPQRVKICRDLDVVFSRKMP